MTTYDDLLKKKNSGTKSSISSNAASSTTYDRLRAKQVLDNPTQTTYDRLIASKSKPVVAPIAPVQKTFGQKVQEIGSKVKDVVSNAAHNFGKFAAKIDVAGAQLFADTVDFSADFVAKGVEGMLKGYTRKKLSVVPSPSEDQRKNLADKWRNFYSNNVGNQTEALKEVVGNLNKLPAMQPSEEWSKASLGEKFTPKHLPETVLEVGPGIVASLGSFAINPALGFTLATGSTANQVNEVAKEAGVSEEKALSLSLGTGLLVGFLDKVVPEEILNSSEKEVFIGALAKKAALTGLKEAGTEITQEAAQILVESVLKKDLNFDDAKTRIVMAGFGGFLGGAGMKGVVGFANSVGNGDIAGIDTEDIKNPEVLSSAVEGAPVERVNEEIQPTGQFENKTSVDGVITKPLENNIEPQNQQINQEKGKPVEQKPIKSSQPEISAISEEKIKTVSDVKSARNALKSVQVELDKAVAEAEGKATVAQTQREGLDTENIAKLKRIVTKTKAFQEGDIETIRASKHVGLVNSVVENIQEVNPDMSEAEALDYALNLPTKAQESARTPQIKELEIKQKKLSAYLDLLKTRQGELNLKEDEAFSKEWERALVSQEKLQKLIEVPSSQLPVGEGKQKVSRLQARLSGALNATPEQIQELGLQTYNQMNQEDQIAKANEYVKNNSQEALKVITGEIDPPKGLLKNAVFKALTDAAETNLSLSTQVATLGSTRFGQEINILKTILADNPAIMMQDVVQARVEAYERKNGRKISEVKESDFKDIQSEIKKPSKSDWKSFVESIQC